jgi:predicted AlkP superfamily pyrophosphatase or phosphodiesterase
MKVKNNYNECLTNLACSIRKYFELDYKHNTIEYIDKILNEKKPKNVVTILCDGMGSNIIDRVLPSDSFLMKHKIKTITSVFPATTVAATTSMMTGLNPVETAMLGWDMYYKDIDKTITTFKNSEKGDTERKPLKEAIEYKNKHMITKSIMEEINEKGVDSAFTLFPFGENPYSDVDDMYNKIEVLCNTNGKKYIYAYDTEPDHTMHELGNDSNEVKIIIENVSSKVEKLCERLKDTIIFVIADHGHKNVENIFLEDYPDIVECLERNTSIESRAVNFFIQKNKRDKFEQLFNKYFNNDFDLYCKEEVVASKLFGDGKENEIFRDILGDYLAIAKGDKAIVYGGSEALKSQHAGYTDDEIYVPLIVIDTDDI